MTKKSWNSGKSVGQKIKQLFCRHNYGFRRIGISADYKNLIESETCFKCSKIKFVKHDTTEMMKETINTMRVKNNFTVIKSGSEWPFFQFTNIGDPKKWF